jgi:DNA-binding transcriptional LysR family regulator
MDIDPRRLQILRAVGLRGGVGEAARTLNLTPSAVSQQLAQLELEVGLPLFDRSQRRIGLTAAGRALAARAERIEAELAEARRELTAISGQVEGSVRMAAFATSLRHLVLPALARLARTHPGLQAQVLELEGRSALRELTTGGADLALVELDDGQPDPRHRGLVFHPLLEESYRVVVPGAWGPPRSAKELAGKPWVAGAPDCASGRALARFSARHRFTPRAVHVCVEFPSMLALVAAGHGAAILPELALAGAGLQGVRVTALPVAGPRRLGALHHAPLPTADPRLRALLRALEESARALQRARPSGRDQTRP